MTPQALVARGLLDFAQAHTSIGQLGILFADGLTTTTPMITQAQLDVLEDVLSQASDLIDLLHSYARWAAEQAGVDVNAGVPRPPAVAIP